MKTFPLLLTAAAAIAISPAAEFFDDFEDGDDGGWTVFDPLGSAGLAEPAEVTFPDGGYRIKGLVPGIEDGGPARVFTFLEDAVLSEFYVSVDLVDWDDTINQAVGIFARAENIGLGQTTGYVCNYDPNQSGSRPAGQFQINYVEGEAAPSDSTMAAANIELIADHSYRMIFFSKGDILTAALYDLLDLTKPVALIQSEEGDDRATLYSSGFVGLFNFYRGDSTDPIGIPDSTFDNFTRSAENPDEATWPIISRGVPGIPSVTSLVPASGTNFASAATGITAVIKPAGENDIVADSVLLQINAETVNGATLTKTPEGTRIEYAPLEDGTIYEARLMATTEAGAQLDHHWRFDTFSTSDLEPPETVVIEAENYNFDSGKYLENAAPGTYRDKFGEFDVDYFDLDTSVQSELRFDDFVGMRPLLVDIDPEEIIVDTVRPGVNSDDDYVVSRTEAGEWLNYTRQFPPADYNVYLRTASLAPQEVLLDVVTGATESNQTLQRLGKFVIHSTVSGQSFEYFQLLSDEGAPATVSLAGEQSLRLTIGGDDGQFETKHTLFLNYLMLIPVKGSAQAFAITSIQPVVEPTPGVAISWPAIPGRSYAVDYSQGLQEPWLELADLIAEDSVMNFTDTLAENLARPGGYYRVRRVD